MRLLDRYLLRELWIPLAYCLCGFTIFWVSFDAFSDLGEFEERQMTMLEIGRYYVVKMPELLVVVMPIALLLALLYALTNHARHNELVAIRAAGISLWRLSAPYLVTGLGFTIGLFALNELWVPKSGEAAKATLERRTASGPTGERERWHPINFRNARDGRIWSIGSFNLDTHEMREPQIAWQLSDGSRRSLLARRAVRTNETWVFFEVHEIVYPPATGTAPGGGGPTQFKPAPQTHAQLAVPEFTETPEQIKSELSVNRLRSLNSVQAAKEPQLSLKSILDYLRLHPDLSDTDYALLHTQLHARLAWPWTCLIVVLIALPFGAASGRRNVFVGVASSIFICFAFFILLRFGLTLGASGRWPPVVAGWLPNVLFGTIGFILTCRVR